jgi:hypothetical protein
VILCFFKDICSNSSQIFDSAEKVHRVAQIVEEQQLLLSAITATPPSSGTAFFLTKLSFLVIFDFLNEKVVSFSHPSHLETKTQYANVSMSTFLALSQTEPSSPPKQASHSSPLKRRVAKELSQCSPKKTTPKKCVLSQGIDPPLIDDNENRFRTSFDALSTPISQRNDPSNSPQQSAKTVLNTSSLPVKSEAEPRSPSKLSSPKRSKAAVSNCL